MRQVKIRLQILIESLIKIRYDYNIFHNLAQGRRLSIEVTFDDSDSRGKKNLYCFGLVALQLTRRTSKHKPYLFEYTGGNK